MSAYSQAIKAVTQELDAAQQAAALLALRSLATVASERHIALPMTKCA
jgi:hypothetical protein